MPAMTAEQYDMCVEHILAADLHLNTLESHVDALQDRSLSEAFTLVRIALSVLIERVAIQSVLSLETEAQDVRGDPEEVRERNKKVASTSGLCVLTGAPLAIAWV